MRYHSLNSEDGQPENNVRYREKNKLVKERVMEGAFLPNDENQANIQGEGD